ncbi:hypothetical protein [Desulfocurvibacter africanus]|uniref:Uncharacterized protein n=1 Tax=Desulfocurvibacter africanus subsp. africanus str. Walvis Bay TaxID=690850 RepID=F3YVW2_DESAF|nr:hypothetical protein [Desulfocurvibacter africanus]EGJ48920.1 hypothetical protein Desaf_0567 [Desulfocurvibacter africanus subsp. africanus str. Walvis Bay]
MTMRNSPYAGQAGQSSQQQASQQPSAQPSQDQRLEQELAQLRAEYEKLKMERVRTEQNLANLSQQLREMEERAQAEYGTADPADLERLLAERRAENARLVEDYRKHIEAIRADLSAVERGVEDGR